MVLIFSICVIFTLYSCLIFFEDNLPANNKKIIYWSTCVLLIILAGAREVGIDPDSEIYQNRYLDPYEDNLLDAVEFSFIWIAQTLNKISSDVHLLFLVYAFLGVTLKFIAFRRYGDYWLLMVFVYISFYFELHETCQIRAGVLSGCMLLAVPYIADGKKWIAFFLMLLGTFFHSSGIILLALLFLSNKPLGRYWKMGLAVSIPIAYLFAGTNLGIGIVSEIPYIGNKIVVYNEIEERGRIVASSLELFSPFHLFTVALFYYLLFWADVLTEKSRYFPIMLKIMALSLVSYAIFSFIPVIGERMGSMYRTIMIVLFPTIAYTLNPKWGGTLLLFMVAFVYINFALRNMYGVGFILSANQ